VRWRPSRNIQVEDRRGSGGLGGGLGGLRTGGFGGGGIPIPVGGGLGGIVLVIIIFVVMQFLGGGGGLGGPSGGLSGQQGGGLESLDPGDDSGQFVNAVTVDVQTFWGEQFQARGQDYPETVTVLFTGQTQTSCGFASSATGPFYCPADQKVYLDTSFFDELSQRFGAPGDFAQAYVIAHEYGHHVQTLTGITQQVDQASQENPDQRNALSVRVELQADCLAGVWAHSTFERGLLEQGDLEEGLTAAASVGDDRIQAETTGRISPETFTHGTAEQRATWFKHGFDDGDATACDTFSNDI